MDVSTVGFCARHLVSLGNDNGVAGVSFVEFFYFILAGMTGLYVWILYSPFRFHNEKKVFL